MRVNKPRVFKLNGRSDWIASRPRIGFSKDPIPLESKRFRTQREAVRWATRSSEPFGGS